MTATSATPKLDAAARAVARHRRADRRLLRWSRRADALDCVPVLGRLALWRWSVARDGSERAWKALLKMERTMRAVGRHDAADALLRAAQGEGR